MKKTVFTLLMFLLGMAHALAQSDLIVIEGRVRDRESREAVPYAFIHILGTRLYTQSNGEGAYCLKVPAAHGQASVVVSAFGYRADTLAVSRLKSRPTVSLKPGGIMLSEVIIDAYTPQGVIDEALRRIPENYHCDTTLNRFFSRCCRLANDSIYLFYESMFTSCRTGYDKNQSLRRLNLGSKHAVKSNYNVVDRSRLLVFDTDYLTHFLHFQTDVKRSMSYNDNLSLTDLVETSHAAYALTPSKKIRKQNQYQLQEFMGDDSVGYYLVTVRRGKNTYRISVRQDNFAITDIIGDVDSSTYHYPDREILRRVQPYASYTLLFSHMEHHYRPVNGKYTLVSELNHTKGIGLCHNQFGWVDAPTEQCFESFQQLQLVEQRDGSQAFLDSCAVLEGGNLLYSNIPAQDTTYIPDYWEENNYIPLEETLTDKLTAILQTRKQQAKP